MPSVRNPAGMPGMPLAACPSPGDKHETLRLSSNAPGNAVHVDAALSGNAQWDSATEYPRHPRAHAATYRTLLDDRHQWALFHFDEVAAARGVLHGAARNENAGVSSREFSALIALMMRMDAA